MTITTLDQLREFTESTHLLKILSVTQYGQSVKVELEFDGQRYGFLAPNQTIPVSMLDPMIPQYELDEWLERTDAKEERK